MTATTNGAGDPATARRALGGGDPAGVLDSARRIVAGVVAAASSAMPGSTGTNRRSRFVADLDERDPDYIRETLPRLWLLPAKITVEALPRIDVRAELGPDPGADEVYDHITRVMQDALDALAAERRLPVIG